MGSQWRENYKRQVGRDRLAQDPADTVAVRDLVGIDPITVTITESGILIGGGVNVSGSGAVGPGSSTDDAIVRFNGTDGNLLQNSVVTIDDAGNISGGTWTGNAVGETFGGTGQTTYITGDMLYASGANTLARLAIGSAGEVLTVVGGVPVWQAIPVQTGIVGIAPTVDNTLVRWNGTTAQSLQDGPVTLTDAGDLAGIQEVDVRTIRATLGVEGGSISGVWTGDTIEETVGGTAQSTYAQGDILYASAADTLARLPAGTDGEFLSLSAGLPAWSAVPSGGAGGSGISGPGSSTDNAVVRWDGTTGQIVQNSNATINDAGLLTLAGGASLGSDIDLNSNNVIDGSWEGNAVALFYGGTGRNLLASGAILVGNGGIEIMDDVDIGTEGQVLSVVGGQISWADAAAGSGGGVSTLDGDAGGDSDSTVVSGIHNRPIVDTAPEIGDAYRWDGSDWIPSQVGSGIGGDFHIILGASGAPTTVVGRLNDPDTVLPAGWSGVDGTGAGPGGFAIDGQLSGGATAADIIFQHPAGFTVKVHLILERPSGLGAGIQWQPDDSFGTWFKSNTARTQTRVSDLTSKATSDDIVHMFIQLIT